MTRRQIGTCGLLGPLTGYAVPAGAAQLPGLPHAGAHNVRDAGAKGDGRTDDTAAFQRAMDSAGANGGGLVQVPSGRYLIAGRLTIPANVTLEGVWRAPALGAPPTAGSVLLAVEGRDRPDGEAFITLQNGSTISGLCIYYPEQTRPDPRPYPWTVRGANHTSNCSIVNLTIINPYQAVDFGTNVTGRHFINGLYAQALYRGLHINQCYDVGRVQNVHFWPFWSLNPKDWEFTKREGVAFTIGKTDGEMGFNLFSIFYRIGMHFVRGSTGKDAAGRPRTAPGSGVYTQAYMDITPNAVRVDEVDADSGVSFANGMFMSGIEVGPANRGQVKFTGCGFWANQDQRYHARLEGSGTVFFESCHFSNWDRVRQGFPCIDADSERVLVTGCEFSTRRKDHLKLRLGPRVKSAVVTSNLMPEGVLIRNETLSGADLQIGFNAGL